MAQATETFQPNERAVVVDAQRGSRGDQVISCDGWAVTVAPIEYTFRPGDSLEVQWSSPPFGRLLRLRINGGPVIDTARLWNEFVAAIEMEERGDGA